MKTILFLFFALAIGYSKVNSQSFFSSYKEKYGKDEFNTIYDELTKQTADSLKNLLKDASQKLVIGGWFSDAMGKPVNKEDFDYKVLLAYVSGEILEYRSELSETDLYFLAWTKEYNSDYEGAVVDYTKCLKRVTDKTFPTRSTIYYGRGKCKFKLEDYYGALNDFNTALKTDPNSFDCYLERGRCYALIGKYTEATLDFSRAIALKPDDHQSYYYRGLVHLANGNKESACLDFSRAGELGYKEAYDEIRQNCK